MAVLCYSVAATSLPGAKRFADYEPTFASANQDGFLVVPFGDSLLVLVGDGCSESVHSAVGMRFSMRVLARIILNAATDRTLPPVGSAGWWHEVDDEFLEGIRAIAEDLLLPGQTLEQVVSEYFLFSFVGLLISPTTTWTFGCGDCVYGINSVWTGMERYKDNRPPYLAYRLIPGMCGWPVQSVSIERYATVLTNNCRILGIASDGILPLINPHRLYIPGTTTPVPSLAALESDLNLFQQPQRLRQRLLQLVKPSVLLTGTPAELSIEEGVLLDDPTLVLVRLHLGDEH